MRLKVKEGRSGSFCEIKHNFSGQKAYVGRARGTRWLESGDESREFHIGRDEMSLAE